MTTTMLYDEAMSKPVLTVTVSASTVMGGMHTARRYVQPDYRCEVNGVKYQNSSKAELRSVIARKNPGFKIELVVAG